AVEIECFIAGRVVAVEALQLPRLVGKPSVNATFDGAEVDADERVPRLGAQRARESPAATPSGLPKWASSVRSPAMSASTRLAGYSASLRRRLCSGGPGLDHRPGAPP